MTCRHLRVLEKEIFERGVQETFRGQAWSQNTREWVYFDCYFDRKAIRKRLKLASCVVDHEHLGTHDGQESGFECTACQDGIMGVHKSYAKGRLVYK